MDQVVEHLPSKCKALSSNPSTEKKKERNKKGKPILWNNFRKLPKSWG
jgi:hypothetical protein